MKMPLPDKLNSIEARIKKLEDEVAMLKHPMFIHYPKTGETRQVPPTASGHWSMAWYHFERFFEQIFK